MSRAVQFAQLVLPATLLACSSAPRPAVAPAGPGSVGASIVLLEEGAELAVVDPDQGSVSILDATSLALVRSIPVGKSPRTLLATRAGALLVADPRGGTVQRIDWKTSQILARSSPCAGPFGLAESSNGALVAVSCEADERIVELDATTLAFVRDVPFPRLRRPRALAYVGDVLWVADFLGGQVHGSDGAIRSLVPERAPERPALTTMTANLTTALLPMGDDVWAAHLLVNHLGDTLTEKVAPDYGSVADGHPKINPAVSVLGRDSPVVYAEFDGGPRAFDEPSALARLDEHRLLVAHQASANVAVLDLAATTSHARVTDVFAVGAGPAGIAVDVARGVAFVDNALDLSVSRVELGARVVVTRTRPLASPYSSAALAGRKLFHDATNRHVTPAGVVACSTCHPEGGDDGLVWFVHTPQIPLKRRRTPHLANAKSATAPFHWDGQFATMEALVRATMANLMGGDGLLVDADSVRAYIDEIVAPPVAPTGDSAAIARGAALFSGAAGCAECHVGPDFTDGVLHASLAPMSLSADDVVGATNTPDLHGLAGRAPYFHDGRSADLRDLLTRSDAAAHGTTSGLDPRQLDDLIAYLRSL